MKESSESQGHMWNDSVKDRLNLKFDDISSSQWVQFCSYSLAGQMI